MYLCIHVCRSQRSPEEGIRFLEAGVTGEYEPLMLVPGSEVRFSEKYHAYS